MVWPLQRCRPDRGDLAGGDLGQDQRGREFGGVPLGGGGAGLDQVQQGGGDGAGQHVAALDVEPDERGVGPGGGLGQGGGGPAGDGDLVQPVEQVIDGQAGAQPDPHAFPDGGGACPQDQRQAAGAVFDDEFGEAGPDAVPGDQAPAGLVEPGADRPDGGGYADEGGGSREPVEEGGVVGELDPAEDQPAGDDGFGCPPPDGADDGPGGHDAPGGSAEDVPADDACEQGDDGVPSAGGDGGGQDGGDDPGEVEHDLGLAAVGPHDRFLDDRDRAVATAEAAVRVRHDATSSRTGCLRDRGLCLEPQP